MNIHGIIRVGDKIIQKNNLKENKIIDIVYIDVYNHNTTIHFKKDNLELSNVSLQQIYNVVDKNEFIKIHRSFIVNIGHVIDMRDNSIYFDNNDMLPMSYKGFLKARKLIFDSKHDKEGNGCDELYKEDVQ